MLRRTLLCAVLACPLAAWRLEAAWSLQAIFAFISYREEPALWFAARASNTRLRGIITLLPSLALQAGLMKIAHWPVLIALTGILAQASLILRAQKPGRRSLAACLISLLVFIACTR